jgi:hypothetical protein
MSARVVDLQSKRKRKYDTLICTECGAETTAACHCRAPYKISAADLAAEAIAKNPEKSARAIAKEIGVGRMTVVRAKEKTGGPNGPPAGSAIRVVGRDGKSYPVKIEPKKRPTHDIDVQVNKFIHEAGEFMSDFSERVLAWHKENKDKLDDEIREALVFSIHQCANYLADTAQRVAGITQE